MQRRGWWFTSLTPKGSSGRSREVVAYTDKFHLLSAESRGGCAWEWNILFLLKWRSVMIRGTLLILLLLGRNEETLPGLGMPTKVKEPARFRETPVWTLQLMGPISIILILDLPFLFFLSLFLYDTTITRHPIRTVELRVVSPRYVVEFFLFCNLDIASIFSFHNPSKSPTN